MRTVYTSIKDITPNTRNWKIKMIVAEKSPKRISQRTNVKYQNLTLFDEEGNRVQAAMFGTDIDHREDTLNIFQSYYISNAHVKPVDPRYKIGEYHYQWTLNSRTIIEDVPQNEEQIETPKYEIVSFKDIDAYKETIGEIDILAVAIKIKPIKEVMTAYGPTTIQEIYIIDESLNPICLTMWGKFVQDECPKISEIIEDKPIILGTKIYVRSKNGLSLSSRPSSTFTINPILPEAATMKKWADDNDLIIKSIIARNLTYPSAPLSSVGIREIMKNCDIAELMKGLQPMEKLKIWIEAKIKVIDLDQVFYYMSCVGCNKGTGYKYNESFVCIYCKNQGVCKPRARAYVELDDNTGKIAAIMFGEVAEKAFGCSAVELMENSEEEHQPYIKNVADKLSTKIWKIQVYADPDKLKEKRHKYFNVLSIEAMEDERNAGSSS